jgi:alkyldihydroxyacetonephosphate synthase
LLDRLRGVCAEVTVDDGARTEAGRDWWPLAIRWATRGAVPARPAVVARPTDTDQVAAVLAACHEARVPVTAMAGRSGVCGASVPAFGGVALDMCALNGIVDIDTTSLLAEVRPGTFGPDLEAGLRADNVTLGHWPQSMDLSTVGGWLACRGAGQYSTRYGKIEDMVVGLEVALADGRVIRTGGTGPRAATGPDLTQMFVGSEGCSVSSPAPSSASIRCPRRRDAGPTPSPRSPTGSRCAGSSCAGEPRRPCSASTTTPRAPAISMSPTIASSSSWTRPTPASSTPPWPWSTPSARRAPPPLDEGLVERWMSHRNDVSALAPLYRAGIVVDTIEIAARWSALPLLYDACVGALQAIEGTLAASAHQSHAYGDGACLYFTFAGHARRPETADADAHRHGGGDAWAEQLLPGGLDGGHGGGDGPRRGHQPPSRHRDQPVGLHGRRPRPVARRPRRR